MVGDEVESVPHAAQGDNTAPSGRGQHRCVRWSFAGVGVAFRSGGRDSGPLLSVLLPPPGAQVEEEEEAKERETEEGKVQANEQRRTMKINAKVAAGGALKDDHMLDDTFRFATTHQ